MNNLRKKQTLQFTTRKSKLLIILSFILIFVTLSNAATPAINSIEDLTSPQTVSERPGVYIFRLSHETSQQVLCSLKAIFSPSHDKATQFDELLKHMVYPHPSSLTTARHLSKEFIKVVRDLRDALGVNDERLPYFSGSSDTTTIEAVFESFNEYIKRSINGATTLDPELVCQIVDGKLTESKIASQRLIANYATFYEKRGSPFRTFDLERYIMGLLNHNSRDPINQKNLTILEILTQHGCLEIQGTIYQDVFTYSPQLMVEAYISKKGHPSKIVLGCGHTNSEELLEPLGIMGETWCGVCKKLPHDDAMVISLDESSADILCDLNHPDLWSLLSTNSLLEIHDETLETVCYTPETIASIARVLRPGGKFFLNTAPSSPPTKDFLESFMRHGVILSEQDHANNLTILMKGR